MWQVKTFKTLASMEKWIERFGDRFMWEEIAVENGYGITFKPCRVI